MYFQFIRTSGISTIRPVHARVDTARATQNTSILLKPGVFKQGPKKTPIFEINTMMEQAKIL